MQDTPADFSDHLPLALSVPILPEDEHKTQQLRNFGEKRLRALKLPQSPEDWRSLDAEIAASEGWRRMNDDLEGLTNSAHLGREDAQQVIDRAVDQFTEILYAAFHRRHLVKNRNFEGSRQSLPQEARRNAPPHLRALRAAACKARRKYRDCIREHADPSVTTDTKLQWNRANARCRSVSRGVRRGFCTDWRQLWDSLERKSPSKMWKTFKQFTATESERILCEPDDQWKHWAEQGDIHEEVWNDSHSEPAEQWISELRAPEMSTEAALPISLNETRGARNRLRMGRAAGCDGIPTDVLRNLSCLITFAHLLFNALIKYSVYPTAWGIGVIRCLLKPGKPPNRTSSLRGIRLLSSLSSWFGRILDARARKSWQACPEQFGFRQSVGCVEAVMVLMALILSRVRSGRRLFVIWIDLRTAFPSLNRPILIHRMFKCGLGIAACRLALATLDATISILCIGKLVGRPFKEKSGVREGAVESPHQFSMYINDAKAALEARHPRLCKLLDVTIALLMYADDAAIPADTAEDLQLAVEIFESFCNDSKLFISVPKTYLTIFHAPDDDSVRYVDEEVHVDGKLVKIYIYQQVIKAAPVFKYLGVYINETCSSRDHFSNRAKAYQRAIGAFYSGMAKLPAYSHGFLLYLWRSLVAPVASYGADVYAWNDADTTPFVKQQSKAWRRMLKVGGRAPLVALTSLLSVDCLTLVWRVQRVALFLRMLNSPAGSLQQIAMLTMKSLSSEWYTATLADIRTVLPDLVLTEGNGCAGPFLHSDGHWDELGEWLGAHPSCLSMNLPTRCNQRTDPFTQDHAHNAIRRHVHRITNLLRLRLRRDAQITTSRKISEKHAEGPTSKTAVLHHYLRCAAPPLHIALGWVGSPSQRAAIAALLCGDLGIGRYAGNFFAKSFIPSSPHHVYDAHNLEVAPSRVCIVCWHYRRQIVLESEGHVFFECTHYEKPRQEFLSSISHDTISRIREQGSGTEQLTQALASPVPADWIAFGKLAARIRQLRRQLRRRFESYSQRLENKGFLQQKTQWRNAGRFVCRHGVFFRSTPLQRCGCLCPGTADWSHAAFMPHLDEELKKLVVVKFVANNFQRLGVLQAQARRRGW